MFSTIDVMVADIDRSTARRRNSRKPTPLSENSSHTEFHQVHANPLSCETFDHADIPKHGRAFLATTPHDRQVHQADPLTRFDFVTVSSLVHYRSATSSHSASALSRNLQDCFHVKQSRARPGETSHGSRDFSSSEDVSLGGKMVLSLINISSGDSATDQSIICRHTHARQRGDKSKNINTRCCAATHCPYRRVKISQKCR